MGQLPLFVPHEVNDGNSPIAVGLQSQAEWPHSPVSTASPSLDAIYTIIEPGSKASRKTSDPLAEDCSGFVCTKGLATARRKSDHANVEPRHCTVTCGMLNRLAIYDWSLGQERLWI
jgi:hypothetical protein